MASRFFVLLLVCAILVPPAAAASRGRTPPGNSGVGEYLEVTPGGGGDEPVPRSQKPAPTGRLSPRARRGLAGQGAGGIAAARAAERTGVAPARPGSTGSAVRDHRGQSPATATVKRAAAGSDSGGAGVLFPAVLVALTAVVVGVAVVRPRGAA
jgi:hypothetical protein